MEKLRVVLAGLGTRGMHWADVAARSPEVTAVAYCDPNSAALDAACARFGATPRFASVAEALEASDDVDAVLLATPPHRRLEDLRPVFDRELPVLVEKPLALSVVEASRFVRDAGEAGSPLMIGLNFRYLAVTQALCRLIGDGAIGIPEFARFTYERQRDGRRPGINKYPLTMEHPMLWEQSIHHFDLMRFVYGVEPVSVYARTWNPSWSMYASDANVSAIFTFEGGLTANYQGTWQAGWVQPHFEWRTDCTNGVAKQEDQFGKLSYAQRSAESLTPVPLPPHEVWITETSALLEAFVRGVRGEADWQCTGADHLASLAMVEACVLSQEQNRLVSLDEVVPIR